MSDNVIEFPPRHAPSEPDDWRKQVALDAMIAITEAETLERARELAVQALVDLCDGDAA